MAGTFPTLSTGSVAMYPVVKNLVVPARVIHFLDDTEQRWIAGAPLNRWTLAFSHLKWADVQTVQTFFNNQKGAFDSSWLFSIGGTSYSAMAFDQDDFSYTENSPSKFSLTLKIVQTKKSGTYATGLTPTYPSINGGVIVQFPFASGPAYLTTRNDMYSGLRYAHYWRSSPLFKWTLRYPNITDAECSTLFDFYASMMGQFQQFSFTDPETNVTHSKCRFGMASLQRTYREPGGNSVDGIVIEETA